MPVADEIRSIVVLPGIALIGAGKNREGPAGLPCPDPGHLPPSRDIVHGTIRWGEASSFSERQVIDIAEDQSMIDVVFRQPSFCLQISNILDTEARVTARGDA